jgi:hypothetical protein
MDSIAKLFAEMASSMGLQNNGAGLGLAPFGLRHGDGGAKGKGFFGPVPDATGGFATEMSADDMSGEFPLMVPTLTKEELAYLLSGGGRPTDAIFDKARAFADQRRAAGRSPFIEPGELRYPLPGTWPR